jgi:hypothetical protein
VVFEQNPTIKNSRLGEKGGERVEGLEGEGEFRQEHQVYQPKTWEQKLE